MAIQKASSAGRKRSTKKQPVPEDTPAHNAAESGNGASVAPAQVPQTEPRNTDDIEFEIRTRAHAIYVARGETAGDEVADWLEAERLVRLSRNPNDGHAPHLLES